MEWTIIVCMVQFVKFKLLDTFSVSKEKRQAFLCSFLWQIASDDEQSRESELEEKGVKAQKLWKQRMVEWKEKGERKGQESII